MLNCLDRMTQRDKRIRNVTEVFVWRKILKILPVIV